MSYNIDIYKGSFSTWNSHTKCDLIKRKAFTYMYMHQFSVPLIRYLLLNSESCRRPSPDCHGASVVKLNCTLLWCHQSTIWHCNSSIMITRKWMSTWQHYSAANILFEVMRFVPKKYFIGEHNCSYLRHIWNNSLKFTHMVLNVPLCWSTTQLLSKNSSEQIWFIFLGFF